MNLHDQSYKKWLTELKGKIRSSQLKAAIAVNTELILFYWDLGKMISEKQTFWGSKLIENLSKDLQNEFPDMKGFSERNLKYCRMFYQFYNSELTQKADGLIGQQPVAQLQNSDIQGSPTIQQLVTQIPWGHNILILSKSKNVNEAKF